MKPFRKANEFSRRGAVQSATPQPAAPHGIRITKLGAAYLGLTVIAALAAINTGNNALFLVFGQMLTLFALSGWLSRTNLTGIRAGLDLPREVYALRPSWGVVDLTNEGKRWSRRWLQVRLAEASDIAYCSRVDPGTRSDLDLRLLFPRRGLHRVDAVVISSLFPFGFFAKGTKLRLQTPILVYPELFDEGTSDHPQRGLLGEEPQERRGSGLDLHSLRPYRDGDDPRRIHWKKTAQSGEVVVLERQAEGGRLFTVLFDNGVGELATEEEQRRFELLISEAATAIHKYMEAGFEVELITRDMSFPPTSGARHHERLLTHLALIQPVAIAKGAPPLAPGRPVRHGDVRALRLATTAAEDAA